MDDRITISQLRINGVHASQVRKNIQPQTKSNAESFQEVLGRSVLKFSHHAEVRMKQRGITFQPETLTKIGNAIDDAAAKGAKDSLVLYRDIAMIVNVPTRTVVTALDGKSLQDNVFTNIDSAVIVS